MGANLSADEEKSSNICITEPGGEPIGSNNSITFMINGNPYTVHPASDNLGPHDRLVDFIRDKAGLRGTKSMCREGGCGACIVSLKTVNATGDTVVRAANSCLIPTLSCDGWDITTVENIGNAQEGYHEIQKRLANFGGTQCGFCTGGVIMNMYSLMESKKILKAKHIENGFDGNICRCTGYRPILDAFKSLASDAPEELLRKCEAMDIEELGVQCSLRKQESETQCTHTNGSPAKQCDVLLSIPTGEEWVKVTTIEKAFEALENFKQAGKIARIVAGNTGSGVFKDDMKQFKAFVDIGNTEGLKTVEVGPGNLVLGGCVTLTRAIIALKQAAKVSGFEYALPLSKHIQRIANVAVRNVGTLAGNLMLKRNHREFPSDLFTIFETVGAQISIASSATCLDLSTLTEFLTLNMEGKIIVSIHFKPYSKQHFFRSFKITRRFQNAHAYVNAGFFMNVDKTNNNFKIIDKPRIVFGGISTEFAHAKNTELFISGKSLKDQTVVKGIMDVLAQEVNPDVNPAEGSVQYRKLLTQTLLYKCILDIIGPSATPELQSGGKNIKRNLTHGMQTYDTDKSTWPINKPVLKLESLPQVSGTAEYINDINPQFGELFGAFVLSTVAKADLKGIDPSEAYKVPGVVRFIKASDIPGTNNYMIFSKSAEEVFATDKVYYAGQAVGLVIAETQLAAFEGAKKVKVEYGNVEKGVMSIRQGIRRAENDGSYDKLFTTVVKSSQTSDKASKQTLKGEFAIGAQYHFQMETQIAICHPREDGMDVYSSTQWIDLIQASVASALKIQNNEVNIQVRRLGGAFGSKITRCSQIATACAVAAQVVNRPVRVALDLETNMKMIGKRNPYLMKYEMEVDDKGQILSLKGKIFSDPGMSANEETAEAGISFFQSMYRAIGWELEPVNIITSTAPNTWCRAPGSTPGIALVENLMEHIAFQLKLDPLEVRLANMITSGDKLISTCEVEGTMEGDNLIPRMLEEIKTSGSMEERKKFIADFNKSNRWRKRGMAIVPMRYPLEYFGDMKYPAYVAIYKNDGTVVVSHGGIESGQGINTKVAQAVALELDIPMEKIRIKPTYNFVTPNSSTTGGSITSELCCFSAQQACKELKARMAPIKEKFKPKTWQELVTLCNKNHVHLSASYMPSPKDNLKEYHIWVVNLTEVEIDVLTGEYKIVRVDIVEDAGNSLNPAIDVGQVEGALIMGIGYWTTEKLIYDDETGQLLSNGTWLYKPPLPKDIPEDMRITLLKNAPNPIGILRSKATGEPPQCSAVAVLFALKNAIYAARQDAGHDEWFELDGPVTVEDVLVNCLTSSSQFKL
ncbi:xanthine dehydrogenase [Folsomia candida]|uniref:xanthine dehydrogenase n=1 Tax=Folsomia candida TaxID=158441 RepID=UPI000B909327|nr:xanthine dehydrogenase [Folsomia candida]